MPVEPQIVYSIPNWEVPTEFGDAYEVAPPINLLLKGSSETESNWQEKLIRQLYHLPAAPKIEPAFLKKFVLANNLTPKDPVYIFKDPKVHIGIEVEVENVTSINPNIPIGFWQIDEDGSLRNHGKEFKTFA